MIKQILTILTISLFSCSSHESEKKSDIEDVRCATVVDVQSRNYDMEIAIEYALSYKYDLTKQTYKVINIQGDSTINFSLSSQERRQIIDKYYSLCLNEIKGEYKIGDICMIMPKFYTKLKVKSKSINQVIIFDEDCEDYEPMYESKGKRAVAFLQFIRDVLAKKPEIKNAPTSDIIYM